MRVLISVDLSEIAEHAFDWYMKNIYRPGTEVYVCHEAGQPDLTAILLAGSSAFPQYEVDRLVKEHESERKEVHEKYIKKGKSLQIENFKVIIKSTHKNPGHDIIKHAEEVQADMIVVGTRGMGTIRRTLLGSVSDYVVHHSKIPVMICHDK